MGCKELAKSPEGRQLRSPVPPLQDLHGRVPQLAQERHQYGVTSSGRSCCVQWPQPSTSTTGERHRFGINSGNCSMSWGVPGNAGTRSLSPYTYSAGG